MTNLNDNQGQTIWSNQEFWYKIILADGTELGLGDVYPGASGPPSNGRTHVKVVPAGQGMVFRYQRFDGKNTQNQGWPIGDKGYLRGIQVKLDGTEVIQNMSLSGSAPFLSMYNDNTNYGIIADQLPGNRVALYAYNGEGVVCGLRVMPNGNIRAHQSNHPIALDCEFVKVATSRSQGLF